MFEGRKYNVFDARIKEHQNSAIEGSNSPSPCALEVRDSLKDFFQKVVRNKFNYKEIRVFSLIEEIAIIAKYLAQNTRNYEPLSLEEIIAFEKILGELTVLIDQTIKTVSQGPTNNYLPNKVNCIREIVHRNMIKMHDTIDDHKNYRDGMLFQNIEDLYKVVHRINTEWDELCSRGFSSIVYTDYWESFNYYRNIMKFERTESEKLNDFMDLLDGKKKFVPVYEIRPVCYNLVDNDFSGQIIHTVENRYSIPYHLSKPDENLYIS